MARIDRERRDLDATMSGLEADFTTNLATSERLRRRRATAEQILGACRPVGSGLRDEYEQRIEAQDMGSVATGFSPTAFGNPVRSRGAARMRENL